MSPKPLDHAPAEPLHALADPMRRHLLELIARQEQGVTDLHKSLPVTRSAETPIREGMLTY